MAHAPVLPLLVAVGSAGALGSGIVYAARTSAREGRAMWIVHVQSRVDTPGERPEGPAGHAPNDQASGLLVSLAADHARALTHNTLRVETFVRSGDVADVLIDLGRDADRIVLQRRQTPSPRRGAGSSVIPVVAARATVPVLAVPEFWNCSGSTQPRITVAVGAASGDFDLMRHAFEAAAPENATLTVLHAWSLPAGWATSSAELAAAQQHSVHIRELLEHRLEKWRERYPGVGVDLNVVNRMPEKALVEASRAADLLLIGRPDSPTRVGELSSLTHAVIEGSQCPVEVVPARVRRPAGHP